MTTLDPGATIGVIGGGQLGRMLILECRRMGYGSAVIDPDLNGPAAQVAQRVFSPDRLEEFIAACQVATYEFEHVNMEMVRQIGDRIPLFPAAGILEIKRNRVREKTFLSAKGFPVASFRIFDDPGEVVPGEMKTPLVIKNSTGGYDGKGLFIVKNTAELEKALSRLTGQVILEDFVPYVREFSLMCARDARGQIALFPPGENLHHQGILFSTRAPAALTPGQKARAGEIAASLAETMGLTGLVGIEMFLLPDGEILINEFAPRPHNSGHYSMDGCNISQFEMLLRVLAGLPLEDPQLLCPAAMLNIIGYSPDELPWREIMAVGGVKLHLYGKGEARIRRKMGHLNILGATAAEVDRKLELMKNIIYPQNNRWRVDMDEPVKSGKSLSFGAAS